MAAIEAGSVCIKTKGRKAGKKVVVVSVDKGFAVIQGEKMKKKKCNIRHLLPVGEKTVTMAVKPAKKGRG